MHDSVKRLRSVDPESRKVICWLRIQRKHLMVMVPPTQEAFTDGWKSSPSPFSATTLKRLLVLLVTQRMVQVMAKMSSGVVKSWCK